MDADDRMETTVSTAMPAFDSMDFKNKISHMNLLQPCDGVEYST